MNRAFVAPESPWLSQAPQARCSRKWARGREEEADYLEVSAGDLLGGAKPPLSDGTQDVTC